ncbi:MAG TPA: protein kinase [Terriglobales bacterium]|nr:protein kinase [Terriglobales bacterium]
MTDLMGLTPAAHNPAALSGSDLVGRFRLEECLGNGGMGEVFRAYDTRLKRQVAIKRLTARLHGDPAARHRFLREAERASQLNHPSIASIHELLEQDDQIYLVMEYVEGQNLRQHFRTSCSQAEFLSLAIQCLEALAAAHKSGILHCDLKPENIMLNSTGHVKVLDFGLAHHLPRSSQSTTLEDTEALAGTPGYMAPELLLQNIYDQRTDIFSLGVVFYEILTGFNPFLASTLAGTLDRILHQRPARISVFNSSVPASIEALVMRMMAKAPEQRYQNVEQVLLDVQQLRPASDHRISNHFPQIRTQFSATRAVRWFLTLLLSVLAGLSTREIQPSAPTPAVRSVLIADFDVYGDGPSFDGAVREALSAALQQSPQFNVISRPRIYEALARMKKADVAHIGEDLARELCRRENLNLLLGGSIAQAGQTFQITVRASDPDRGLLLFSDRVQIQKRDEFFSQIDSLFARVRANLGEVNSPSGRPTLTMAKVTTGSLEALQLYSQAIDQMSRGKLDDAVAILKRSVALDPNFAMAHLRLGQCYSWGVGKNALAVNEFLSAYQLRSTVTDREKLWIESQYFNVEERYEEAAQALGILLQQYPDDPEARRDLAMADFSLGQVDNAIRESRQALQLDPNSSSAFAGLFFFLVRANRYAEAIALYQQATARGLENAEMNWGLGLAHLGIGDPDAARQAFIRFRQGSADDRNLADLYLSVVDLYEGKLSSAVQALEKANHSRLAGDNKLLTVRQYLLGRIRLLQGDKRRAQRAANIILSTPPADLQTVDLVSAGTLFAHAGNLPRARSVLKQIKARCDTVPSGWNKSSFYNLLGEISLAEAHPDAALAAFHSALEFYPDPFIHAGLASAYKQAGDLQHASQEWKLSLEARGALLQNGFPPDLPLIYLELGRVSRQLNDLHSARSYYNQALGFWRNGDDLKAFRDAASELKNLETQSN